MFQQGSSEVGGVEGGPFAWSLVGGGSRDGTKRPARCPVGRLNAEGYPVLAFAVGPAAASGGQSMFDVGRGLRSRGFVLLLGLAAVGLVGMSSPGAVRAGEAAAARPGQAAFAQLEAGVYVAESKLKRDGQPPLKVWLYSPTNPPKPGLALVSIAPAGTNLITGMRLADGDRPEHLPYVRSGYAVISYELDGAMSAEPTAEEFTRALLDYQESRAGVDNASLALGWALGQLPSPNLKRVYAAGHSSAATHALVFASQEPRIRAVAAYAPVVGVREYLGPDFAQEMSDAVPGYKEFLDLTEPLTHAGKLQSKPVFLFAARDDAGSPEGVKSLLAAMKPEHASSKSLIVKSGGHYDSMIEQGVPAAIKWFGSLKGD